MTENTISVPKTARYFTAGDPSAPHLLYVLHGYGQLPAYFLRKFEILAPLGYCIVAPEGLHRFYLEGASGRVGASWMTREARENDIADNLSFLDTLHEKLISEAPRKTVSLLGFSQGGATAARWKQHNQTDFRKFILWASVFPEDVPLNAGISKIHTSENHFVLGTEDPYFTEESREKILRFYADHGFRNHSYAGKHAIYPELLPLLLQ